LNFAAFVANDPVKRRQEEALKAIQEKKSSDRTDPTKQAVDPETAKLEQVMKSLN